MPGTTNRIVYFSGIVVVVGVAMLLPRRATAAFGTTLNRRVNASLSVLARRKHASSLNALIRPPNTCPIVYGRRSGGSSLYGTTPFEPVNATYSTTSAGDASDSAATASLRSLVSEDFLQKYQWDPTIPPDRYTDLPKNQRVVVMGDVHGDIPALQGFLQLAGVINTPLHDIENVEWTGGDTILISLGDILDRGANELACLQVLATLSRKAKDRGGAVHLLFGNHESLNAAGLFQYALEGGNDEYESVVGAELDRVLGSDRWRLQFAGNQPARWAAMEPGGILSQSTLQYGQVAVQVGRTVCVHAGLTTDHLEKYGGLEGMNKQAREWILASHHGENNNLGNYESVEGIIASAQGRAKVAAEQMPECLGGGIGSESPVWMRDFSQPNDAPPRNPKAQGMIDDLLSQLDADRLVMGHTPQFHINAALKGKAWRVDVGASKGVMGAPPQVLEVIHGGDDEPDTVTVITPNGRLPSSQCCIVDTIE